MIEKFIEQLKQDILECVYNKEIDNSLTLIKLYAEVAYNFNQFFVDEDIENCLIKLTEYLLEKESFIPNEEIVLFYDGFGLNSRGLIQIYLKALCKIKKVVYVTNISAKNNIPDILEILKQYNGVAVFLKKKSDISNILYFNKLIYNYKPMYMFMYTYPQDVICPIVFNNYKGIVKRYQINLTDHAFWIGRNSFDYDIEFRNWGASLSYYERKIDKDKMVLLPFYPYVNNQQKFLGYPADFHNKRFIFSGGSLYKTLGGNNYYYRIVDYILRNHDVIFWYAGSGCRKEMDKLIDKYPGRIFLTEERVDFFQILQRCEFYLSTYPICGGLMFQYAAKANKIPVTLKNNDIVSDFLINQDKLGIEFCSFVDIKDEINKLLCNKYYLKMKNKNMNNSLITELEFEKQLENLLKIGNTDYKIDLKMYDLKNLKDEYRGQISINDIYILIAKYKKLIVFLKYTLSFLKGRYIRTKEKLRL